MSRGNFWKFLEEILRRKCGDLLFGNHFTMSGRHFICAPEPGQHSAALEVSWFSRQESVIGRIGPIGKVGDETVLLWILVDVDDESNEIGFRGHWYSAKWTLKERAGPMIGFVDRVGVGVKEVGKGLAWIF